MNRIAFCANGTINSHAHTTIKQQHQKQYRTGNEIVPEGRDFQETQRAIDSLNRSASAQKADAAQNVCGNGFKL